MQRGLPWHSLGRGRPAVHEEQNEGQQHAQRKSVKRQDQRKDRGGGRPAVHDLWAVVRTLIFSSN